MPKKKKKNRSYARYRWREKHRKQYTFTKTKFVVGFLVSVLTSVFLGSYFDHYGRIVLHQLAEAVEVAIVGEPVIEEATPAPSQPTDPASTMMRLERKLAEGRP
ncbi:MAG: hypothetical protein KDD69_02760 [Bdellovibrionales bacterium]|nr:hypothetical protein [Bdellovibrionales bacterium]